MKKSTFLLALATLLTTNSFSQDKGYIASSGGLGIPVRDFASKDINNKAAGYANQAAVVDLFFGYKLGKNLDISAMLRGQSNH